MYTDSRKEEEIVTSSLDASLNDIPIQVIHTISGQVVNDALAQFPKDSAELDMAGTFVPETALATRDEQIMTVIKALVDEGEMLVTQETEAGEIVQEIVAPQGAEAEAIPLGSQEGEKEAPAMKGADEVNILSVDDQAPESAEDNGAGGDLVEEEVIYSGSPNVALFLLVTSITTDFCFVLFLVFCEKLTVDLCFSSHLFVSRKCLLHRLTLEQGKFTICLL